MPNILYRLICIWIRITFCHIASSSFVNNTMDNPII